MDDDRFAEIYQILRDQQKEIELLKSENAKLRVETANDVFCLHAKLKMSLSDMSKDIQWLFDGHSDEIAKIKQSIIIDKEHANELLTKMVRLRYDFNYNSQKTYRMVDIIRLLTERVFDKETADAKFKFMHIITTEE
jgi:hypothetical protein